MSPSSVPGVRPRGAVAAVRSPFALIALLIALVAFGMAFGAASAHAADRNFAPRFTANDTGDIDIFGNTLMTCPTAANGCTAAQQSGVTTTADSLNQNNAYNMQYIDVDGDASTFNSSRSTVSLPAGSQVLFAGLYWGGRITPNAGGAAPRNAAARNTVKFRAPGASGYTTLTAETLDDGGSNIYQGYENVTDVVKAAGSGVYTVADVQAATGPDMLAGWSLVIAYRDTAQPARNLSIFDGLKSIGGGQTGSIAISGFQTPPAGQVRTRVGFVTYEGDAGIVGDTAQLNGTTLSDAQHAATNFFNSRSSRDGVRRTATDPNYPNNLGIEQSILLANGILGNNATSATIGLSSTGDVYAPGVVTFATELYAPKIEQTKTVQDVNGGNVEQGDTLRYTISGQNTGQDGAVDFALRDPIPTNTTYVPGTLKISPTTGGSTTAAVSDASGDDRGEYDAANRRVVARLGTGSSATAGGTVGVNATYTVTFDVVVGGPSPAIAENTVITNTATSSFASQSLGTQLTAASSATATVRTPDLTLTKTGQGTVTRGQPYTYAIAVKNDGQAPTQGTVTVTDTLPTGLSFRGTTPVSGTGWTCTTSGSTFTCTRSDALAAGSSYPTITLNTDVASNAPSTVSNTASVAGGGDGDLSNNTGTATNTPGSSTDLAITKTADLSSAAVGQNVTYTLRVTNNGTSDSTGSTVTDALPAGLTYVSSDAACTGSAASTTVTCATGPLAANASRSFTVVAKPALGSAGTTKRNTASVAANEPDPTAGNNSASTSVDVKPVDLAVTNTISGNPAILLPNTTYTWNVGVQNLGGSAAPGTNVMFDVPADVTVVSAPGCTLIGSGDNRVLSCDLGTVAAGETKPTIQIQLRTSATPPALISTIASVASSEPDVNTNNNKATTSTPVDQSVDLATTLTHTPGSPQPGDNVTFTATVTNNGPARPVDPRVTIPVPAGTTFVSAPAGCALNGAGDAVVCTLPAASLDAGGSVSRAIVFKVADDPGPVINATATASTTSKDTDPSNDKAADAVGVVENVDLGVTLSSDPGTARPGQNLELTAVVTNNGPGRPWAPTVTIPIPAGTTFVSAADGCALNSAGTAVVCNLDPADLGKGDSVTKKVVVKVGDDPGATIPASATVATTSRDTNAANNSASLTVPVNQTVDLGVTLTTSPGTATPGQNLTVTAEVVNNGAGRPVAPKLTVPVPAGTTFVSAPAGCALNAAGTAVVCDLTPSELDSGEKVTRAIVFKVADTPGSSIPVSASVSTTSTDTNRANDTASTSVPVVAVDLATTITTDPGTATPGQNLTLNVAVTNNGPGRPQSPRVTVPIPAGTTFVSAPAGCTLNAARDAVVCELPADGLDQGETVTRGIVVKVNDDPPASLNVSATASTTSPDTNRGNDTATKSVPVNRTVDLAVKLTSDPGATSPGEELKLTATIKNNGTVRPADGQVTIDLPTGTTIVGQLPNGCVLNAAGTAVVCTLDPAQLGPNGTVTRDITVRTNPNAPVGQDVRYTATVSTTSPDTNAANDRSTLDVPVVSGADVSIRKTTSSSIFQSGDAVDYTLVARNNGPGTSRTTVVTDTVPSNLQVQSATVAGTPDRTCTVSGNAVRCDLGDLPPGREYTVTIRTTANATAAAAADTSAAPKVKAYVEQAYETLQAGGTKTIDVTCEDGGVAGIATDGTLQIVQADTGDQSKKDVQVLQASATSASTYRFVVKNATTGSAQVRPHVTCLPAKTDDGQHDLVVGPQQSQVKSLPAGRTTFDFPVANGDRAIAPGIRVIDGGQVRLVGSEPIQGGYRLTVDALEPATVEATLRELDDLTGVAGDPSHVHQFTFAHVEKTVVVPANSRLDQQRVECNTDGRQGYEGIVASYDLPAGVVSLGNIPEPVNRDFDLLNTTDRDQTVTIDLECIRLQTGAPIVVDQVVNTAEITSATNDQVPGNNSSSARVGIERKPAPVAATPDPQPAAPAPAPAPAPVAAAPAPDPAASAAPAPASPAPAAPSPAVRTARASVLASSLRVTGTPSVASVAVPVQCTTACSGTAQLVATSALRSAGIKKGTVLATASVKLTGGTKATLRLKAKGKVAKALRRGGIKKAQLLVKTGRGVQTVKTVRLVLR